jgi:hypothetical protein
MILQCPSFNKLTYHGSLDGTDVMSPLETARLYHDVFFNSGLSRAFLISASVRLRIVVLILMIKGVVGGFEFNRIRHKTVPATTAALPTIQSRLLFRGGGVS